ncbi:MAG: AbrB/MazE/SpoVT family DNA-binding domain-containing protein [Chloroflexi bacterium]|nr:AbrB/MazE/SpoVT family DNA-binding domain-containing protein [Chloroflexota bacterium]
MSTATITSKGQITLPKSVRDALGLREHDQVIFLVEGDKATMMPVHRRDLRSLAGIFKGRVSPFPGRETEREAFMRAVAEHVVHPERDED